MPTLPNKLRKQYSNSEYPNVILRFEDGHQIEVAKGHTKAFDCYEGERVKVLAQYDPTTPEREKVDTLRAEQFDDAAS